MPSQVWGRDPQEAFESPYEYGIQDQFAREATALLAHLYRLLNSEAHQYSTQDRSTKKAIWLLAMDALDSLRETLASLQRKEHRIAGKLFRDVVESMDLAAFFHSGTNRSVTCLRKWYDDKIVPHREYRDHMRKTLSPKEAERLAKHYSSLSRFTHRSYRAILDGYSVGGEDRLVHDRTGERFGPPTDQVSSMLVLPETIASYFAVLANLILEYSADISELQLVDAEDVRDAFASSIEKETVARRFTPRRWLVERLACSSQDENVTVAGRPGEERAEPRAAADS
jgi:hypothetical protein